MSRQALISSCEREVQDFTKRGEGIVYLKQDTALLALKMEEGSNPEARDAKTAVLELEKQQQQTTNKETDRLLRL